MNLIINVKVKISQPIISEADCPSLSTIAVMAKTLFTMLAASGPRKTKEAKPCGATFRRKYGSFSPSPKEL